MSVPLSSHTLTWVEEECLRGAYRVDAPPLPIELKRFLTLRFLSKDDTKLCSRGSHDYSSWGNSVSRRPSKAGSQAVKPPSLLHFLPVSLFITGCSSYVLHPTSPLSYLTFILSPIPASHFSYPSPLFRFSSQLHGKIEFTQLLLWRLFFIFPQLKFKAY